MAVDHKRPLPVPQERLDAITDRYVCGGAFDEASDEQQIVALQLAMMGELVEHQQLTNFFLQEAYDIYNARFR